MIKINFYIPSFSPFVFSYRCKISLFFSDVQVNRTFSIAMIKKNHVSDMITWSNDWPTYSIWEGGRSLNLFGTSWFGLEASTACYPYWRGCLQILEISGDFLITFSDKVLVLVKESPQRFNSSEQSKIKSPGAHASGLFKVILNILWNRPVYQETSSNITINLGK